MQAFTNATRIARVGGDEFLVLLPNLRRPEDAAVVAQRLVDRLAAPLLVDGQEFFVTASVGIAVYPDNGSDIATLLNHSDAAMYHAKESGRNTFEFWAQELSERAQRRLWVERQLRRALESEELINHYQPRVDLRTNRVVGVEALARWWVDGEFISPGEFIPVAEDTGLVKTLGDQLLLQACRDAKRWLDDGLRLVTSVNIAPAQLCGDFLATVAGALEEAKLPPELLEVEITERTLMQRTDENRDVLLDLKSMGITVTVDDFGTGYSSLSYLARFPIDVVKIDRSFVSQVVNHENSATITAAVIALSHSLGATVVGEGVETAAQLEFLRRQRCEEAQGYLLSRPLPFGDLARWATDFNRPKGASLRGASYRTALAAK
jgi:predicted signal transduction protein with EAL and GGDEF domain